MCNGKRHKPASDEDEDTVASNGVSGAPETALSFFAAGLQPPVLKPSELLAGAPAPSEPILVYTGPTRTGAALIAAVSADADEQAASARHRGKKSRSAKKPEAAEDAGQEAKSSKPAKHASAKGDAAARTADKPAAADKPKPKAAAKPAKPKPDSKSTTGDAGPLDQKRRS
jgi:D-alanyl-D-alanine carboxypeptidase